MANKETWFKPDFATPPGETLAETLEAKCMTQADLAERTGRPRKTINEIIQGKAAITPQTAIQFERVLSVPAAFWNNLERNYREYLAHQEEQARLGKCVDWLKKYPVAKMIKQGWLPEAKSQLEKITHLLNFLGLASPDQDELVCGQLTTAYRKAKTFKSDEMAVAVWLRKGEMDAQNIVCAQYNPETFEQNIRSIRKLTLETPEVFGPKMRDLCSEAGVALVFTPELPSGTCLCGASRWLSPSRAIIQLSARYKTDDQLWFTFFHECCHVLRHSKKTIFLEETSKDETDVCEKEADEFAGDLLIPSRPYQNFVSSKSFGVEQVKRFARSIEVAPGIVVGRLQHDRLVPWHYSAHNMLKVPVCLGN